MANNINRFEVSLLSRSRASDATREEVMIDKDTGQVLVKNAQGHLRSFDHQSRTSSMINSFVEHLRGKGVYTTVYMAPSKKGPYPVVISDKIINDDIVLSGYSRKCYIMVDINKLSTSATESSTVAKDVYSPTISFNIGSRNYTYAIGESPIIEINYTRANNVTISNLATDAARYVVNCVLVAFVD